MRPLHVIVCMHIGNLMQMHAILLRIHGEMLSEFAFFVYINCNLKEDMI